MAILKLQSEFCDLLEITRIFWIFLRVHTHLESIIALFGIFLVRYGKWFLRLEQVENAPKFPRPSEGGNKFTNGFQNLTNKHPFSRCSLLLAVLVLERKVIPNTANGLAWLRCETPHRLQCIWKSSIYWYGEVKSSHFITQLHSYSHE